MNVASFEKRFGCNETVLKRSDSAGFLILAAVDQLNPTAYVQLCRQTHYDLGSISYEMLEIKAAAHANDGPAVLDRRLKPLVDEVVSCYDRFFKTFEDKEGKMPEKAEDESEVCTAKQG